MRHSKSSDQLLTDLRYYYLVIFSITLESNKAAIYNKRFLKIRLNHLFIILCLEANNWFHCYPGNSFNCNGSKCSSIIQINIFKGISCIMVTASVYVIVFHKQNNGDAGIGKNLAVSIEYRTMWIIPCVNLTSYP